MTRLIVAALLASVLLGACGSISADKAMTDWATKSGYLANAKILANDVRHSVTALRNERLSNNGLHTVCGVLDYDATAANSSLPTPDRSTTALLAKAYDQLGSGANLCYRAGVSEAARARAIAALAKADGYLAEGTTRVLSSSTP